MADRTPDAPPTSVPKKSLLFPEFVSGNGAPVLALDVAIDQIPEEKMRWVEHLHLTTQLYVEHSRFMGHATIWSYVEIGGFASGENPYGAAMIHVAIGLPERFLQELELRLQSYLGQSYVAIRRYVGLNREDGWRPVCHVEQGIAWRQIDADEWEPILSRKLRSSSKKAEPPPATGNLAPDGAGDQKGIAADNEISSDRIAIGMPSENVEIACAVRTMFSDGVIRTRNEAIRGLAVVLGYKRVGSEVRVRMNGALIAAVRRGILVNSAKGLEIGAKSILLFEEDQIQKQFLSSLPGRSWTDRDAAILGFARWLGFARTGSQITKVAKFTIRTLSRQKKLEVDGTSIRRIST